MMVNDSKMFSEEDIDWNDPDLINNPEKLMKLQFDEPLLQAATSPTFSQSLKYFTDFILGTTDVKELLARKNKKNSKKKSAGEADLDGLGAHMDKIVEEIEQEHVKYSNVYLKCKAQPFWDPKVLDKLTSQQQQAKMREWADLLEQFTQTFGQIRELRTSRASSLGVEDQKRPQLEKLVKELRDINVEIENFVKIFENLADVSDGAKSSK